MVRFLFIVSFVFFLDSFEDFDLILICMFLGKVCYIVCIFGICCNEKIVVYVIVCGFKVEEIFECGFKVKEYELCKCNFFEIGNFGFGIFEYIDFGIKYDFGIGIYGMDFYCCMICFGECVVCCCCVKVRVGVSYCIICDDIVKWFK